MIRKLEERDKRKLMNYLITDKEVNLFMIGDLENYRFDNDFQEFWGEFDEKDRLKGVLLRYYTSFILYTDSCCSYDKFADIIESQHAVDVISGKREIIENLEKYLDLSKVEKRVLHLCKLDKSNQDFIPRCNYNMKAIEVKDVDAVIEMLSEIEEFSDIPTNRASFLMEIQEKKGRGYIVLDGNKVISTARTAAENSYSAMVVGVATKKGYRKQSLASACMYKLCQDLLYEGKTLCLFYDNPEAGSIYKKVGFREIGKWTIYRLQTGNSL